MKKLLVLATAVSMAFFSCKDSGPDEPIGGPKAPETYTQKVIVEYTTCAGCPYCPDGPLFVDQMVTLHGANKVYSVAMHNLYQGADMMAGDESKSFSDLYSAGNPTGMVNRIGGKCETRSNWKAKAASVLDAEALCGLSIDAGTKTGFKYAVKVKLGVGKADLPAGSYYVIAYLTKSTMTGLGSGWDQANGYNGTSTHSLYNKGNPIKNYIHHNVLMKSLNTMSGTKVAAEGMKAGALSEYNLECDMTGLDPAGYEVTAFVFFKSVSAPFVQNVQRVALGSIKAFD